MLLAIYSNVLEHLLNMKRVDWKKWYFSNFHRTFLQNHTCTNSPTPLISASTKGNHSLTPGTSKDAQWFASEVSRTWKHGVFSFFTQLYSFHLLSSPFISCFFGSFGVLRLNQSCQIHNSRRCHLSPQDSTTRSMVKTYDLYIPGQYENFAEQATEAGD